MLHVTKIFADQVSAAAYVSGLLAVIASIATFVIVLALALIDGGLVNPKHLIDTLAQKLFSAFIAGGAFMICGYPVWYWQFNQAFGIPHPFQQALSDWWLFGTNMTTYAQNLDPAALPGAETLQVFVVFFIAYAAVFGAFVHSMGLGRMKPSACYILAAFAGGVLMPVMTYLTWGPAGPLTNNGLHDFVGAYSLYLFVGMWGLILAWRLGPRLPSTTGFNAHMCASGALILMAAIPFFVLGCGFLEPGSGYFGVTNTTSGVGIVFINVFMAFIGGTVSSVIIAYRKHKPIYVFLGPIAGYVSCTALYDIASPGECFIISLIGPWLMRLVTWILKETDVDDQKLVPVALGPALLSVVAAGIVGAGVHQGGMPGATGAYTFQHATIGVGMQLWGLLVTLLVTGGSGLVLVLLIEKTIGLRVPSTIEQDGMDMWYWNEWRKSRKMRVSPKSTPDYQLPARGQKI
jgi:ammonium transporter, Amt family